MQIGSILFAAGRGERLRPLTDALPKPALPMLDIPLGEFCLVGLLRAAPPVVVNASHLPETVGAALVSSRGDVELIVETPEPFGTGGTLAALAERVGARVMTCNSDLLTDLDPTTLLEVHRARGARATVAAIEVDRGADFEISGGRATAFIDRREQPNASGGLFIGMAVFERSALDLLPRDRPAGLGETLLRELATRGDLAAHVHDGYAMDVGTPARYLAASLDLLYGDGPSPPRPYPGEITQAADGRCYVSRDATVEGSLGDGAIVLARAVVEAGAHVERAIVWPDERVPDGTVLKDAIWLSGGATEA